MPGTATFCCKQFESFCFLRVLTGLTCLSLLSHSSAERPPLQPALEAGGSSLGLFDSSPLLAASPDGFFEPTRNISRHQHFPTTLGDAAVTSNGSLKTSFLELDGSTSGDCTDPRCCTPETLHSNCAGDSYPVAEPKEPITQNKAKNKEVDCAGCICGLFGNWDARTDTSVFGSMLLLNKNINKHAVKLWSLFGIHLPRYNKLIKTTIDDARGLDELLTVINNKIKEAGDAPLSWEEISENYEMVFLDDVNDPPWEAKLLKNSQSNDEQLQQRIKDGAPDKIIKIANGIKEAEQGTSVNIDMAISNIGRLGASALPITFKLLPKSTEALPTITNRAFNARQLYWLMDSMLFVYGGIEILEKLVVEGEGLEGTADDGAKRQRKEFWDRWISEWSGFPSAWTAPHEVLSKLTTSWETTNKGGYKDANLNAMVKQLAPSDDRKRMLEAGGFREMTLPEQHAHMLQKNKRRVDWNSKMRGYIQVMPLDRDVAESKMQFWPVTKEDRAGYASSYEELTKRNNYRLGVSQLKNFIDKFGGGPIPASIKRAQAGDRLAGRRERDSDPTQYEAEAILRNFDFERADGTTYEPEEARTAKGWLTEKEFAMLLQTTQEYQQAERKLRDQAASDNLLIADFDSMDAKGRSGRG